MVKKTLVGILLVSFFILPKVLLAGEMDMGKMGKMGEHSDEQSGDHHKHIMTLKRVLKFERNFLRKSAGIKIGYIYKKGNMTSEMAKDMMMMMSKSMTKDGLDGKPVSFIPIDVGSSATEVGKSGVNVVYLGMGLSMDDVMASAKSGKSQNALIMGSMNDHVQNGHAAVGIIAESDKIRLVINLKTAKETGADFDPRLLRLADEVIK